VNEFRQGERVIGVEVVKVEVIISILWIRSFMADVARVEVVSEEAVKAEVIHER
jgi:hypothetical protein